MNIDIESKAKRRIPQWAFVGPAVAALLVGYFALGPISLVVAVAVFAVVVVLALWGPRVNDRLYGGLPATTADLLASAVVDHVAGRVQLDQGLLTWKPRHARSQRSALAIPLIDVSRFAIQPLPGIPATCRLRAEMLDGSTIEMTIFMKCDVISTALRAAAAG